MVKALYINTMLAMDPDEIDFMVQLFRPITGMSERWSEVRRKYALHDETFTAIEFRHMLSELLFYLPNMERLQLTLPSQLSSRNSDTSTMILSNALASVAEHLSRVEQDPELEIAPLKTLVLDGMPDYSIMQLWNNPLDIKNMSIVFRSLEHVVLGLRRQPPRPGAPSHTTAVGLMIWSMLAMSGKTRSICLSTMDINQPPYPTFYETTGATPTEIFELQHMALPLTSQSPAAYHGLDPVAFRSLKVLEFRRVEVDGSIWMAMMRRLPALEELNLFDVTLQTCHQTTEENNTLWIGRPNERPPEDHCWVAIRLRERQPRLKAIRASRLGYHRMSTDDTQLPKPAYDLADTASELKRPLCQRFVEVVKGYKQPDIQMLPGTANNNPFWEEIAESDPNNPIFMESVSVEYLGHDPATDEYMKADTERQSLVEHKTTNMPWHEFLCNETSWAVILDGWFPSINSYALREFGNIVKMACDSMKKLQMISPRMPLEEHVVIDDT